MNSSKIFFSLLLLIITVITRAQDSLITEISKSNMTTFSVQGNSFKGKGWDELTKEILKSDFVLIGEDHFSQETPFFTSAIASTAKFDNYFCEIDPYSAKILESKIKTLSETKLNEYINNLGSTFSFYALEPEFNLLKHFAKTQTTIYGTDQILMVADRLICSELSKITKSKEGKIIYETISKKSKTAFEEFIKDNSKPLFIFTQDFENETNKLLKINISIQEKEKIKALQLSAKIYKEGNHNLRIQLMKNNLMHYYTKWYNKKNLFKYGAIHMPKGESLLTIYDIGNLVNNIADSQFKKSLHIMVIGKSGTVSPPYKGGSESKINENGDFYKSLQPLYKNVDLKLWNCFNTRSLKTAIQEGKLVINDIDLLRMVKGYDYIVIIPEVSPAPFLKF